MPQKGSKKSAKKSAPKEVGSPIFADDLPGAAPAPTVKDYMLATLKVVGQWIKAKKRGFAIGAISAVLIVAALAWLLLPSPQPLSNDEIVIRINKELSIRGDGNPAVLTVKDKAEATQPFMQDAENGDVVVLYYKAKKSVLFRPSERRIVHHGSYTPSDAKVFVRAGTQDTAKVSDVKAQISKLKDIKITSEDSSVKKDYVGVTLVNVTDRYDEKVRELEELFNTKVVRLPTGESFPEADILVIVGN